MLEIRISEISPEHPAVRAAILMVAVHQKHGSLAPALDEVSEQFPMLSQDQIILLWMGVNAKSREHIEAA